MFFLYFVVFLACSAAAQQCYNSDGSKVDDHIPCKDSVTTHCCLQGAACLTNGLCFYSIDSSLNTGTCTQKQWDDDSCFQTCIQTLGRHDSTDTLYRCNDNYWCCSFGGNTTSCCDDTSDGSNLFRYPEGWNLIQNGTNFVSGFTIAALDDLQTSAVSTATSTGTTTVGGAQATLKPQAASSTSSVATSAPTALNQAGDGKKVVVVGAGVGVGVGVPLLAALGAVLFLYLREKRTSNELRGQLAGGIDPRYNAEQKKPLSRVRSFQELQADPLHHQLQGGGQDVNAELYSPIVPKKPSAY